MVRAVTPLLLALALAGCSNLEDRNWGEGGSDDDDEDTSLDSGDSGDTDDSGDSDDSGDTDESGDTDDSSSSTSFDVPGDLVEVADQDGILSMDLTDESGDSNVGQDFYMVLVNTTESNIGYNVRYYPTSSARMATPPRQGLRPARGPRPAPPVRHPASPPPPSVTLTSADIGSAEDEFLVRDDIEDADYFAVVNATLWGLGDNVAIWVDNDVYIDWDYDCDGIVDQPAPYGDANGFDNCDLANVADIIDDNIVPNVRNLYGQESDLNGDGKVSVVITPVLNTITLTSEDESDWSEVLSSYAEPEIDLQAYDYDTNPGSDEQEVIYVFAPDPEGYANPAAASEVEDYTSYQLAAEVARSFTTLVIYNQKLVMEEDWLVNALGTFAADYCGFGAAWHTTAWEYLDSPHLYGLVTEDRGDSLSVTNKGAQYLFARWLFDYVEQSGVATGEAVFQSIVQSEETSTAAVEDALTSNGFSDGFNDLAILWQVALLTTGVTDDDGDALVDATVYPPYGAASTIVAPPDSAGGYYGANGYQLGMNIRGTNQAFTDGVTDTPTELTSRRVRMGGQDHFTYVPGFEFVGYMEAGYSAQVVRLTDIPYEQAIAQVQASETGIIGAVVRWNDPLTEDYSVEDVFSPTTAISWPLPSLPDDGSTIYGIGRISDSPAATVIVVTADGDRETSDVEDTDRWLLDLTDRTYGENIPVTIWLDRRYETTSGGLGLEDPWIAVAPVEFVPEPTSDGISRGACVDGVEFSYPTEVLDYLYTQVVLSSTMQSGSEDEFDACGEMTSSSTTCDEDWDRDNVLDADEPEPASFYEQVLVMECTANGNVAPAPSAYSEDWLDVDELDEDEVPTRSLSENTGGKAIEEGEEGYVHLELEGGQQYLIVVAAGDGSAGTYELSVRQADE